MRVEGIDEIGEDAPEDHSGKVFSHPLFVAAALGNGIVEKGGCGARLQREGIPPEEEREGAQGVVIALFHHSLDIRLIEGVGAGAGAEIVEPPDGAVGQNAPANAPIGSALRGRQVAQDLAVGRAPLHGVTVVAVVQRQAVTLALLYDERVLIAVRGALARVCPVLRFRIGKEEMIGNVLIASRPLLRQVVAPR